MCLQVLKQRTGNRLNSQWVEGATSFLPHSLHASWLLRSPLHFLPPIPIAYFL